MVIPIFCYERGLDSPLVQAPGFVRDSLCDELAMALNLKHVPAARFWDFGNRPADGLAFVEMSPETVELSNTLLSLRWGHWQIRQVYLHEVAHHIDYALRGFTRHDRYYAAALLLLTARVPLERLGFKVRDDGTVINFCRRGTFERHIGTAIFEETPSLVASHLTYLYKAVDDWAYHGQSGFAEEAIEGLFNHLARSTI